MVVLLALGWWIYQKPEPESPGSGDPVPFVADSDTAAWDSVASSVTLVDASEPGTPLVIFGQVFAADGHVIPKAQILVYQADASGEYGTSPKTQWARLSGRLKTDSLGRYLVHTVRPGSYGGPAHVHFAIGRSSWAAGSAFELRFADDPANSGVKIPGFGAADTGTFATVRGVVREPSGVLRVRRDFRLP